MEEASPARLYCLLVGAVLVIAGIIGFFYEASFASLFVGILNIVLCVLGFIATSNNGIGFIAENDTLFRLVPVNNEDNILHLILGLTGVIAFYASRPARRTAPAT